MRLRRHRSRLWPGAAARLTAATALTGVAAAPAAQAAAGCGVTYSITSQWQGGFTGNVTITNIGDPSAHGR